ncbi:MAG: DUF971 domain-containing protein [Halobacteria archaeon]|nr:DUF971 domain-containing protein [Halobacteria archaeon]
MTEPASAIVPTDIKLHQKSRLLEIGFADDTRFMLPCEYLRVFAPAAAGEDTDTPVHGKQRVEIMHLEPQGTEALQLDFDDGFSGRYSWETLHALGVNHERNWQDYLQVLGEHGLERGSDRALGADGKVTVKLLYFIQLAKLAGRDEEAVELPESVTNVETLLAWLRNRRAGWEEAFAADRVQVTVNKHFSEPYTLIEHGDEVALVPRQQ